MRTPLIYFCIFLTTSCSSLPTPGPQEAPRSEKAAVDIINNAAFVQGSSWDKYREVKVAYDGKWSTIATRLQPVITDPGFRKSSVETYHPKERRVSQLHFGPQGIKRVHRKNQATEVIFNDSHSQDADVIAAAALVSDAYTMFLFGPSWLRANGQDFHLLEHRKLNQETCQLVAGRLVPGIGSLAEDHFIAWIGEKSGLMNRLQFSLNALDSTRGADVDVTFSEFTKAKDGSIWPTHFVEYIQRPILVKAHEWRMTSLTLDDQKVR